MIIHICRSITSFYFKKPYLQTHVPRYSVAFCCLFFSSNRQKQPEISIPVFDYLLNKQKISHETAAKAASQLAHLKNPETFDALISFFEENGFSHTQLEKLVKSRPRLLAANLEKTIMPKFKFFRDFGFSCTDIADIISRNPVILHLSLNGVLAPSVLKLEKLLGSGEQVRNLLKRSPFYLSFDLEKTLLPNVQLLQSFGFSRSQMVRYICRHPQVFLIKLDRMKNIVKRIDEMGMDRDSKMFFQAVRPVWMMSDKTWKMKLGVFRTMGLSENDILRMFRKMPVAITVSVKKFKNVLQFLLDTGKYDVSCVVNQPGLLLYSLEGRLKPRLQVLRILESKNLLHKFPSLGTISVITNEKFDKEFVSPYLSEVGHVYKRATMDKTDSDSWCWPNDRHSLWSCSRSGSSHGGGLGLKEKK